MFLTFPFPLSKIVPQNRGGFGSNKVNSPEPFPKAHWMSMPLVGDVMANAFEV
jgi:hypothetical protein